jgi:hypothetical protein
VGFGVGFGNGFGFGIGLGVGFGAGDLITTREGDTDARTTERSPGPLPLVARNV